MGKYKDAKRLLLVAAVEFSLIIQNSFKTGSKVQNLNLESKLTDDSGSYVQIGQEFKTVLCLESIKS